MTEQDNTTESAAGGPTTPTRDHGTDPGRTDLGDRAEASAPDAASASAGNGPPTTDDDSADADNTETGGKDARYRQQLREAEAELAELRGAVEERDQLADRVREYVRAEIAREYGLPVEKVPGDSADAMRAAAQAHKADIDAAVQAEMARRGINPAAPISEVTSDGRAPAPTGPSFTDAFRPKAMQE